MKRHDLQSGRDHYNSLYEQELHQEAQWLDYGAKSKTDSIELLLRENHISPLSVLELGCGTGSILRELQRRHIGTDLIGIDYSSAAIEYARSVSHGIKYTQADIASTDPLLPHDHFDVIVISHVLEHLEAPEQFLQAIHRISFGVMIAEVPLEDLPVARIKTLIRDRKKNTAGHVNFFTARSFNALLRSAGFQVSAHRRYFPLSSVEAIEFGAHRNHLSPLHLAFSKATGHYLPRYVPFWTYLYYGHYAVPCTKG